MHEARTALQTLGVPERNLHFLDLPDDRLRYHKEELSAAIARLIDEVDPDQVLAPFRYDRHPDHLAVHGAAAAHLKARGGTALFEYFVYYTSRLLRRGDVREYIRPELLVAVDIRPSSEIKRRALECYESQTTRFFDWQARPNLTDSLLTAVCNTPELFLEYSPSFPGPAVFKRAARWIQVAHWVEPHLKKRKDQLVAAWRGTLG